MTFTPTTDSLRADPARLGAGAPARDRGSWRFALGLPLVVLFSSLVAWSFGSQSVASTDAGAAALLGIVGPAWAGRRRF